MSGGEVLFLHGFAGAPAMWQPVIDEVAADVQMRAVCPVLPGHGTEPGGMEGSFEDTVDRLRALVSHPRLVVVGYSLGARLALSMAVRHPHVSALLIGAHVGLSEPSETSARRAWEREQVALLQGGLPAFLEAWERLPIFASQSESVRSTQRAWRHAHTSEGLAWAMDTLGLGRMPCYRDVAVGRWVTGERDEKFTKLAASLGVAHRTVPDVGHNVVLEAPGVVAEELRLLLLAAS